MSEEESELSLIETSPLKLIALVTFALVLGIVAAYYRDEPIVQGLLALHFLTMIIAPFVYFGRKILS